MRYREIRFACDTDLTAAHGQEARRARLVNVSLTGGRIAGLDRLPRDTLVTLTYLDHRIAAKVVWSSSHHTGIRFVHPLSPREMTVLRQLSTSAGSWAVSGPQVFRELT